MAKPPYVRTLVGELASSIRREGRLLHILTGARQTGKSTAAGQLAERWTGPVVRASADLPLPPGPEWIETHWEEARRAARKARPVLLILDEIQKVRGWSESAKALSEEDRASRRPVRVLLLGSSALLVRKGLAESLAGRFLLHDSPHWTYGECAEAFGWSLDRWIYFGGYPGAARLARRPEEWRRYVADALVETAIARDVLQMETVAKPALLRQVFGLAAARPAEILSYNKMLGTLQDAGNTTTLAHYLRLLESAFLVSGLEQASPFVRRRGSTPKLVVWNNALVSALSGLSFEEARRDGAVWGRWVENAVGAHLLNHLPRPRFEVAYWRERDAEVDYVVRAGRKMLGLEVKSGRPERRAGLDAFRRRFPGAGIRIVGRGGIPLEDFFRRSPRELFEADF